MSEWGKIFIPCIIYVLDKLEKILKVPYLSDNEKWNFWIKKP